MPEAIATLYFDLLGLGNRDASVIFDNIRLIFDLQTNTPPITQDDAFSISQNAPVTINPLNNDTDPDDTIAAMLSYAIAYLPLFLFTLRWVV